MRYDVILMNGEKRDVSKLLCLLLTARRSCNVTWITAFVNSGCCFSMKMTEVALDCRECLKFSAMWCIIFSTLRSQRTYVILGSVVKMFSSSQTSFRYRSFKLIRKFIILIYTFWITCIIREQTIFSKKNARYCSSRHLILLSSALQYFILQLDCALFSPLYSFT